MKATAKRVLRSMFSPLYSYFEPRFRSVHDKIDESVQQDLRPHLDRRLDSLTDRVSWVEDRVNDRAGDLVARLDQLETRVTVDTQTAAEFTATLRRAGPSRKDPELLDLVGRAVGGDHHADHQLAKLLRELLPTAADRLIGEHVGLPVADLGPGAAAFLNWATGHTGPSGQAGVWLNPPVTVLHGEGWVRHNDVNERIVEVPYAMGVAASLAPSARVLDVGAAESTLALSLASLGLDVIAIDLRPYPFEHPKVRAVEGPIQDWSGPEEGLDAIFCVSSIEHFGLGAYGEEAGGTDLDRRVVERFGRWLVPGGELVLTAPYGPWALGDQQRVYDAAHLDALLEGWKVLDRRICVQTGRDRWESADGEPPPSTWADGTRGVVLLRAAPPG